MLIHIELFYLFNNYSIFYFIDLANVESNLLPRNSFKCLSLQKEPTENNHHHHNKNQLRPNNSPSSSDMRISPTHLEPEQKPTHINEAMERHSMQRAPCER